MISPSSLRMKTPKPAGPGLPRDAPSTQAVIFICNAAGRDVRRVRARRPRSSLRWLQVENAMAPFAVHQLAALELLVERGTDAGPAGAAGVVRHLGHGHALALLEDALELATRALGQRGLELVRPLPQRLGLGAEIAQGVLPLVVLRTPPHLDRRGAAAVVVELLLQPFDLRHR